ncbi:unnamed protein product, partial [Protopolystoma xenopodis]
KVSFSPPSQLRCHRRAYAVWRKTPPSHFVDSVHLRQAPGQSVLPPPPPPPVFVKQRLSQTPPPVAPVVSSARPSPTLAPPLPPPPPPVGLPPLPGSPRTNSTSSRRMALLLQASRDHLHTQTVSMDTVSSVIYASCHSDSTTEAARLLDVGVLTCQSEAEPDTTSSGWTLPALTTGEPMVERDGRRLLPACVVCLHEMQAMEVRISVTVCPDSWESPCTCPLALKNHFGRSGRQTSHRFRFGQKTIE